MRVRFLLASLSVFGLVSGAATTYAQDNIEEGPLVAGMPPGEIVPPDVATSPPATIVPGEVTPKPVLGAQSDTLAIAALIAGVLLSALAFIVVVRGRDGWSTPSLSAFGLPLIVSALMFLIAAGFTKDQIAPTVGVLGSIAGYLLANSRSRSQKAEPQRVTVAAAAAEVDPEEQ